MSPEWFIWYGLRMGLSFDQTMTVPFSQLLDLIAIEQIKTEGFRFRSPKPENDDELMMILSKQ